MTMTAFVERGLYTIINLCGFEHLTLFSVITNRKHPELTMTFHHLSAFHHMIGGISGILVKVFFIYTFTTYRFTGQCGFVQMELYSLYQFAISGNFLTGI